MQVTMHIRVGEKDLKATFQSNVDAMEVYTKLFDALLDGEDENGFEIGLEVSGDE